MSQGTTGKVVAACFALAAFAVAIVAGLANDNPATSILVRGLTAMFVCYPLGLIVGMVCERVVSAHVQAHQDANPVPESSNATSASPAQAGDEEPILV
jgi:hypothetical protein